MEVKISKIANELYRRISPVREIMSFTDKKKLKEFDIKENNLISFGGGWVNQKSPKKLQESYLKIINDDDKFHFSGGYSPTNGELFYKEALVKYEKEIFNMRNIGVENIVIGQSSSHLTYLLLRVLLNTDDKILLLDPSYCNYPMQVYTSTSSKIIRFPVIDIENYSYTANNPQTISSLKEFLLKNKPKIVMLISPDNPSGQVLSDDFVSECCETVKTYGGTVVMDFAYKEITFVKNPKYFSWGPDANFITIHSNSKWCRGLGRRLGWIEAPKYIIDAFESLQNSTILSPDRLHQIALANYIEESIKDGSLRKYIEDTRKLYSETAKVTINAIKKYIKLPYLVPQGGLYTCIKVNENSAKFVERVLRNTGVLLIPGWGFGSSLNKSVRLSYGPLVYDHDLIIMGLNKVGKYLRNEDINNKKN